MKQYLVSAVLILLLVWTVVQTLSVDQVQLSAASPSSSVQTGESGEQSRVTVNEQTDGQQEITVGLRVGNQAPDFTLHTLEGEEVTLSDLRGKKVILTFWATWCPNCRAEMPAKTRFYHDFRDEVEILAVNLIESELSLSNVEQFVAEQGIQFPVLLDQNSEAAGLFQALSIPTSYLLDTEGVIRYKVVGALSYDALKNALDSMP